MSHLDEKAQSTQPWLLVLKGPDVFGMDHILMNKLPGKTFWFWTAKIILFFLGKDIVPKDFR